MHRFPLLALLGAILVPSVSVHAQQTNDPTSTVAPPPQGDPLIVRPVLLPKVEFAVINAPDADFLQSEFFSLPTSAGVRVDSISLHPLSDESGIVRANLEVHWRWAEAGRDSVIPKSRRMQFLDRLPGFGSSKLGTAVFRSTLRVDTIWTCQGGRCVIAPNPKVVNNYSPSRMECMPACVLYDSAQLVASIRERVRQTGVAIVLHPLQESIKPMHSLWRQTTGSEDIPSLCVSLPGNAANWITEDFFKFSVSPVAYTASAKPTIPRSLDYRTGPASYMYDRTSSPNLTVVENQDLRVINDTLVKIGKSMLLEGSNKIRCGVRINDSLVGLHSWFVAPDSTGSAEAIDAAMTPGYCQARSFAWRMSGDTVWLGNGKWPVLVSDLLSLSGSLERGFQVQGEQASLIGNRLELPWSATVSIRDLSGRRLGTVEGFESGVHALHPAGHRGAFLVEIRSHDGKVVQVLKGNVLAR
ncbi:MAG TPA: hypothetical protein PKO15_11125 [Fibrobacteria bacterium]|nr:hypothetical protein [Fibrobacteria bacterium]